jgi:hypothetical protein
VQQKLKSPEQVFKFAECDKTWAEFSSLDVGMLVYAVQFTVISKASQLKR